MGSNVTLVVIDVCSPFSDRMSTSYSYYGLTFGINSLSGNLYLNMFLMNTIDGPVNLSIMFLLNRYIYTV